MENETNQIFVLTAPEGQIIVESHNTSETAQVNLQDASLSSVCRTCATVTDYVIPIFSGEGLQNNLADKIHKHLPIQVSSCDSLPQAVCYQCASTLLAWHELVACCVQADAALRTRARLNAAAAAAATATTATAVVSDNGPAQNFELPPSNNVDESAATETQQHLEQQKEQPIKSDVPPPPPPQLSCRYCGAAAVHEAARRAHLVEAHAESLFECEECGEYVDIGELIAHMSGHAGEIRDPPPAPPAAPVAPAPPDRTEGTATTDATPNSTRLDNTAPEDTPSRRESSTEPTTPSSVSTPSRESSSDTSPSIIETPKKQKRPKVEELKLVNIDSADAEHDQPIEPNERDVADTTDDNEFSDRSDSEDGFGPLPDSVFEAIEDSQDGDPDDSTTIAPEKPEKGNKKTKEKQSRSCPICFKEYTVSSSYFYHMKYSHRGVKEHACAVCGRRLATRAGLAQHLLTHSDQLAYECKQCGKKFRTKASLYVHTQGHKGDKNWSCDQCGRRFVWRQLLLRHMKRHLVEKSHVCTVCNRGFSVRYDLLRHARTHTAGCHTCEKCGAEFAQVRYLKVHMDKKHKAVSPGNGVASTT